MTTFPSGGQNFAKVLESMISGYEVLEEMPRGGQAAVYKAIHTATRTKVAIKVLLPTLLASARARHYFEREAELIASLDRPNIVSIRDSGIIHHQYYFVMQYIDGQPLERYVRRQDLSFREIVILFSKVCTAITYAHQQGVIHRDLKFGNILVDKRGEPHVLDFGLAKAVGLSEESPDRALATMTGQLSGTLSTMSPEQAAGRPDQIDVRTDVYSLGVMLYHMLTGRYPYDVSGSTLEAIQNIQNADPVRLTAQTARANALTRPVVFTSFLNAWKQGNRPLAARVVYFLSDGSRERKAAGFLINPKAVAEKEAGFRKDLLEKDTWFADFIIGENHLNDGNRKEAIEAYRCSYEAIQRSRQSDNLGVDKLYAEQVRQRLDELGGVDKPSAEGGEPVTKR